MVKKYILSLDQGTTSSRAILFDHQSKIVGIAQKDFSQIYPKAGWVEHDPISIWNTQKQVMMDVIKSANISPKEIAGIGITNQRETTVVWNKKTGVPIYNAIVWQCRRTASMCDKLKADEFNEYIRENTGLVIDAYFSATKIQWILDNVPNARKQAENDELLFGTIDTWLLWNLTGGKSHATDYSNASRTMLFNIKSLKWDNYILEQLEIPANILPEVKQSCSVFGYTDSDIFTNCTIPIAGIAGDQQAALFGQACFKAGSAKSTYGTGCFLMMNTGSRPFYSNRGLLTTIAWGLNGKVTYALEGSVFIGGAAIQWLRDEMNLIDDVKDSEYYAQKVKDSNGVYVVPAFVGLGAPYWDMYARGAIFGLTRGANKNHIIRATLESIAYQAKDVFNAISTDCQMIEFSELKVDGGAAANNFLMQFQADILGIPVYRPEVIQTTALGAAYLAGLGVNFWANTEEISECWKINKVFRPEIENAISKKLYDGWKKAVERSSTWIDAE